MGRKIVGGTIGGSLLGIKEKQKKAAANPNELSVNDMPEYQSAIDADTMRAKGAYGQKIDEIAMSEGPTSIAQRQIEAQKGEQAAAQDQSAKQSAGGLAQARRAMAMRGGAGGGSAERMAQSGARDLMTAQQGVTRQGAAQRADILSQDENRKMETLGGLQDMAVRQLGSMNQARQADFAKRMEVQSADKMAAAQRSAAGGKCFHPDTLILMETGNFKKIKDIQIDDVCMFGGKVYEIICSKNFGPIYNYQGTLVTEDHAVLEEDVFVRVKDSHYGSLAIGKPSVVFNISNEFHRVLTSNGVTFADNDEVVGEQNLDICLEILNKEQDEFRSKVC